MGGWATHKAAAAVVGRRRRWCGGSGGGRQLALHTIALIAEVECRSWKRAAWRQGAKSAQGAGRASRRATSISRAPNPEVGRWRAGSKQASEIQERCERHVTRAVVSGGATRSPPPWPKRPLLCSLDTPKGRVPPNCCNNLKQAPGPPPVNQSGSMSHGAAAAAAARHYQRLASRLVCGALQHWELSFPGDLSGRSNYSWK